MEDKIHTVIPADTFAQRKNGHDAEVTQRQGWEFCSLFRKKTAGRQNTS